MVDKAFHRRTTRTEKTTNQPNWSELPPELLELILKSLTAVDIIHIKAVCSSWMHAVKHYPLPQSPWLMLPSNDQNNVTSRCFFDVAGKPGTFYTMTNLFRGFSDSWCIGGRLRLPEIGTIIAEILTSFNKDVQIRRHISKVVLSSDPARNNNFTAAALFKEKQRSGLAYCKKGYITWIELYKPSDEYSYSDVIFHNDDQLFELRHRNGWLIDVWNLKENPIVMKTIRLQDCRRFTLEEEFERFLCGRYETYLVECLGEILLVERAISLRRSHPNRTVSFEVFKVNLTNSQLEKVECLDDRVLFFDVNQSVSLSTRDFSALERNSIYFTDDRWCMMRRVGKGEGSTAYGGNDIGVYTL
ncbi:hypothetical protein ACLB2K_034409 [Fragaria x ananassa]